MTITFLTPQEVYELTGRKKKSAQAIELKFSTKSCKRLRRYLRR